jgi:hypothetical protein
MRQFSCRTVVGGCDLSRQPCSFETMMMRAADPTKASVPAL